MRFLCHIPIIALLMIGSSPELVAQDWANLKRFQKENQQLSPPHGRRISGGAYGELHYRGLAQILS